MEELFEALAQAFADYRQDLDNYERKRRLTDGLLGFGRSLGDDSCHDRLDGRVRQIVSALCAAHPSPAEAERALGMLLRDDMPAWPLAAQWMLRAIERHSLPLIPFLSPEAADAFYQAYRRRYRPYDRLPAQREVCLALKAQSRT